MTLSILIRSIIGREESLNALLDNLNLQIKSNRFTDIVEVLVNVDNKEITSGAKANILLQQAKGEYIVFIDDDDEVPTYYVREIIRATYTKPDCIATNGTYTIDGRNEIQWFLSKDFDDCDDWSTGVLSYKRRTNHISPVKRELALLAMFPDKSNAEDKAYSEKLIKHLKTEVKIDPPMYHYKYRTQNKSYI